MIHTPDQQVYIRKLLGYHFRIEYKPSCTNLVVDALSRIHKSMDVDSDKMVSCLPLISRASFDFFADIRSENSTLPELLVLHQKFATCSLPSDYSVCDGFLLYRHCYYISHHSPLKAVLLNEFHSTPLVGHAGVKRTLVRLSSTFYWLKMHADVKRFVEE